MPEDLRSRIQSRLAGSKGSLQDSIAKAKERFATVKPPLGGAQLATPAQSLNPYASAIQRGAGAIQPFVQQQYPGSVAARGLAPYAQQPPATTQPYPPQGGQPPFDRGQIITYLRQWVQNVLSRYGINPREVYEPMSLGNGGGSQQGENTSSPLGGTTDSVIRSPSFDNTSRETYLSSGGFPDTGGLPPYTKGPPNSGSLWIEPAGMYLTPEQNQAYIRGVEAGLSPAEAAYYAAHPEAGAMIRY
ncbi:hypothetical protein HYZ97_04845 [Candidatus Pacearchaeota archaeon]|nr:hypothetical protein [Candidatus Pacearchaeota archaeon]